MFSSVLLRVCRYNPLNRRWPLPSRAISIHLSTTGCIACISSCKEKKCEGVFVPRWSIANRHCHLLIKRLHLAFRWSLPLILAILLSLSTSIKINTVSIEGPLSRFVNRLRSFSSSIFNSPTSRQSVISGKSDRPLFPLLPQARRCPH